MHNIVFFACFHDISLKRIRFGKIAFLPCSARAAADRQTDRRTQTDQVYTVTLAAHAR